MYPDTLHHGNQTLHQLNGPAFFGTLALAPNPADVLSDWTFPTGAPTISPRLKTSTSTK